MQLFYLIHCQVGTNAGWGDPVAGWGDANPVNSAQQNWDTPNDDNAPAEPAPTNDWNTGGKMFCILITENLM